VVSAHQTCWFDVLNHHACGSPLTSLSLLGQAVALGDCVLNALAPRSLRPRLWLIELSERGTFSVAEHNAQRLRALLAYIARRLLPDCVTDREVEIALLSSPPSFYQLFVATKNAHHIVSGSG
jgi:hypothetical protein